MLFKTPFLFLLGLFLTTAAIAQEMDTRKTDWQLRTGGTVEYKLNKKWELDFSWESRFKKDISEYDKSLLELATSYKTPWDIKLHAIFRHYLEADTPEYFRYTFGAGYDKFIGDSNLEWAIRTRWQRERDYSPEELELETIWRNKFSLVYELNKQVVLVLEDELFYEMGDKNRWDKNRITAAVEFELTDALELTTFYRFENELSRKVSDFDHTIGIYLKYEIKRNKEEQLEHFGRPLRW